MPKIDDAEDLKRLNDLGASLAQLQSDFEKSKEGSKKADSLAAEIAALKVQIQGLIGSSPAAEAEVQDHWAGYWSGLLA